MFGLETVQREQYLKCVDDESDWNSRNVMLAEQQVERDVATGDILVDDSLEQ